MTCKCPLAVRQLQGLRRGSENRIGMISVRRQVPTRNSSPLTSITLTPTRPLGGCDAVVLCTSTKQHVCIVLLHMCCSCDTHRVLECFVPADHYALACGRVLHPVLHPLVLHQEQQLRHVQHELGGLRACPGGPHGVQTGHCCLACQPTSFFLGSRQSPGRTQHAAARTYFTNWRERPAQLLQRSASRNHRWLVS